jgi:hypothetical protein
MKRGMLSMSRVVALGAILLSVGMIPPTNPEAGMPSSKSQGTRTPAPEGAEAKIEVRLRKLHLVRPDLIPYPIHYDIYC